jgi:hypothetical protein
MSAVDGSAFDVYQGASSRRPSASAGWWPNGGVPADGEGLAGEHERDGPLDGSRGTVTGLPGAEQLFCVLDRDFNCPPRGISFDDERDARILFRGDEGEVAACFRFVPDEDDGDGHRAGDGVPQAGRAVTTASRRGAAARCSRPGSR